VSRDLPVEEFKELASAIEACDIESLLGAAARGGDEGGRDSQRESARNSCTGR
jgi:hypothetical protein